MNILEIIIKYCQFFRVNYQSHVDLRAEMVSYQNQSLDDVLDTRSLLNPDQARIIDRPAVSGRDQWIVPRYLHLNVPEFHPVCHGLGQGPGRLL